MTPNEGGETDPEEELLVTYNLDEIEKYATNEIALKANSTVPKVSLQFELSRSQFIKLKQVQVKIDETVVEEIVPEAEKTDKKDKAEKTEEKSEKEAENADDEEKPYTGPSSSKAEEAKDEDAAEEAEEGLPEAPKEKQYKTYIKPHLYEVKIDEKLNKVRTLDDSGIAASKKRIKALEKRDENLAATNAAKNFLETQIYELRSWIQESENEQYVSDKEKEKWITKCGSELEWFDDNASGAKKAEFNSRGKVLEKQLNVFRERKNEHGLRTEIVPQILETIKKLRDELPTLLESKPWITEDEGKDAYDRLDEVQKWLDEQLTAQNKRSLAEDPLFKSEDIEKRLKKATDTYKKVTNKK